MEPTGIARIILGLLLIGILVSIFLYTSNSEFYNKHQTALRKIYYGVILLIGYLLWATKAFPFNSVAELTTLIIGVVIIDLFVFQTPVITKFLSQEFKPLEAVKTIENTDELLVKTHRRILMINNMMPKAGANERTASISQQIKIRKNFDFSYKDYEEFLLHNLTECRIELNLPIHPYFVTSAELHDDFLKNIETTYKEIRAYFRFSSLNEGMRMEEIVETLADGKNINIKKNKVDYVIMPFWGFYYNTLFVFLNGEEDGDETFHLANIPLVLNLLYSLELWLDSYKCGKELEKMHQEKAKQEEKRMNTNSKDKQESTEPPRRRKIVGYSSAESNVQPQGHFPKVIPAKKEETTEPVDRSWRKLKREREEKEKLRTLRTLRVSTSKVRRKKEKKNRVKGDGSDG